MLSDRDETSYAAALAIPEFRAIFGGAVLSVAGNVTSDIVLTVLIFERTRSPVLASLTFTLGFLPFAFTGTLLSGIVDRVPPRRLLAGSYLGSAMFTVVMAVPGMPAGALLALLLAAGTMAGIANATQGGLLRQVVPEATYVPARSLQRIAAQAAQIGGNPVGGLLIVALSPRGAFLVGAAMLAAAAASARFGLRRRPVSGRADGSRLVRDSVRGMRQVFSYGPLRRLMLLGWLVPMFSVAPEALAAPYIVGRGGSPALVGWWLAALPAGVIAGDLLGVMLVSARWQRRLVGPAAAASFLPYLVFFATPPISVAVPLLVVSGAGSMYSLGLDALVRRTAPERLFARMMALNSAGLLTVQAAGFPLAGAIGTLTGPGTAVGVAGICGIVAVLWLRPRRQRERDGDRPATRCAASPGCPVPPSG